MRCACSSGPNHPAVARVASISCPGALLAGLTQLMMTPHHGQDDDQASPGPGIGQHREAGESEPGHPR